MPGTRSLARLAAIVSLCVSGSVRLATSAPTGASLVSMRADAGLAGVGRSGRWMPVRIHVSNDGPDLTGELVLRWGHGSVRRAVMLASPARATFELLIRTSDPAPAIEVQLRSGQTDVRSIEVPVRVADQDETVTLCVADEDPRRSTDEACTGTLPPEALPRSLRGYDAADRMIWQSERRGALAPEQRAALARWDDARRLDDSGLSARTPTLSAAAIPTDGVHQPHHLAAMSIGAYLIMLATTAVLRRRTRRPIVVIVGISLVTLAGSLAAAAVGRFGPGATVTVRHATTIRQLPGGGALVGMQGVIEYPAFDTFDVRADGVDATLFPKADVFDASHDLNGAAHLAGLFGLGARQTFVLEGATDFAPLEVAHRGEVVQVTNRSKSTLDDCRFPDGFSPQSVGSLRPGQSSDARVTGDVDEPFVTCRTADSPIVFSDPRHAVRMEGPSLVSALIDAIAGDRE